MRVTHADTGRRTRHRAAGDVSSGLDLVENFFHEAGHSLGLGHPSNGEASVMAGLAGSSNRQRDAYQYDLKCLDELSTHRSATGSSRSHSNGSFGSQSAFTGTWQVAKGSVSQTKHTGSWDFSATYNLNGCLAWTRGLNTSNTYCVDYDLRNSISPRVLCGTQSECPSLISTQAV
jgi:hypothetical protein